MVTASSRNRGYFGGLAAGSQPGGGFGSSLQSSFQSSMANPSYASAPKPKNDGYTSAIDSSKFGPPPEPWQAAPREMVPAPDMSAFTGPAPLPGASDFQGGQPPPRLGQPAPLPVVGSAYGAQPPPSPFGQPALPFGGYRARGGPVMPGRAYMVGERGPEMIVPQQPGMVIPNGATPSPMNHSYGGGLADRGPVPVGRGIDDPQRQTERLNRIARQRFGQTGDPSLMYSMNWRGQMGRGGPLPPMGPMPTAAAPMQPPAMPAGRFVPGRSTGSQVWMQDVPADVQGNGGTVPQLPIDGLFPPGMRAPTDLFPPSPMPQSMPGTFSAPLAPWQQPMMPPQIGGGGVTGLLPDPNKGAFDPAAPLPSSPLAHYTPPAPALEFRALPGNPGYGAPVINGEVQKQFLPMPQPDRAPPPGLVPQAATIGGVQYGAPAPAKPAAMPKFQQDTNSGKMFYVVPNDKGGFTRKWVDEDGNGTVSAAEQSKATAAAVQTAAGNRFRPVQ